MIDPASSAAAADQPTGKQSRVPLLVTLVVLGFAVRFALSAISYGSDDAWTFRVHGNAYNEYGFRYPFEHQIDQYNPLNHPPLPLLYAAWCDRVTTDGWVGFQFLFRLPMILTDGMVAAVLYALYRRSGKSAAWGAAAVWAWSPLSILNSAYHCNTDSAVAGLTLLSAALLAWRRPLLAGLAVAAAANIKIVPFLAMPVLAAACTNWPAVVRFGVGVAVGLTPMYLGIAYGGQPFIAGVFGYKGYPGQWGPAGILFEAKRYEPWSAAAAWMLEKLELYGRWLLLAVMLSLAGLAAWQRGRWSPLQLGAMAMTAFMVFAPSFAVQYLIYPLPLLMAVNLRRGASFGLLAGIAAGITYAAYLTVYFPLQSQFKYGLPPPAILFGFAAWVALCGALVDLLRAKPASAGINRHAVPE